MAEKAGFSLNDLFGKRGPKKGSGQAKYRNPKDTSQTWTGRGRKPNWLVDAVKKGAKIEFIRHLGWPIPRRQRVLRPGIEGFRPSGNQTAPTDRLIQVSGAKLSTAGFVRS